MGDRANIVVYDPSSDANPFEAVFLYTHWAGCEAPERLKAGLVRGKDRWNDGQYLARILFQDLVGGDSRTTGYGITTRIGDNSYPLLVVDVPRQVVVEYSEAEYTEHGFANLASHPGVALAEYSGAWNER